MSTVAAGALAVVAGGAQAADVMPIVVPVVTPAVVPPPGPVKVVQIETVAYGYPSSPVYFDTAMAVDVRTASGWGFQLSVINYSAFVAPLSGVATIGGRVYRAVGDATVGIFGNAGLSYPGVTFEGFTVGVDADYRTDAVKLYYALGAEFDGGFERVQSILVATVQRGNYRVEAVSFAGGPPFGMLGVATFGYTLGPVTPFVVLGAGYASGPGFFGTAGVGLEVEHDVGESLTLTGLAVVQYGFGGMGGGLNWGVQAGFEYTLGGGDGPLSIRGSVATGSGGGLSWQVGLGLKFGDGRVTGFSGLLFDDALPEWFAL